MKHRCAFLSVIILSGLVWGQSYGLQPSIGSGALRTDGVPVSAGMAQYPPNAFFNANKSNVVTNTPVSVDNSIDESEYVIGGGDVFFISFMAAPTMRFTVAADRNGNIYIPEIGLIEVGNVTLAEAKTKIIEQLEKLVPQNKGFYLSLVQVKNAVVSVTGEIVSPGSYEFSGATRLLDVILAVNGGTLPQISGANLRQVQLTRGDSVITVDIMAYLHKDDRTQNPYIYPGDRVKISPVTRRVFIAGAIKTPATGFYPIKENETLKAFLTMFTFDNAADTGEIVVFQTVNNSTKTITTTEDMYYTLNDLDAITIPIKKNHPGIHHILVSGEVASPGHYPIIENVTSVKQLIEAAGGMKATGSPDQAVVMRASKRLPGQFRAEAPNLNVISPERGTSITAASMSHDYTIIRVILYNADKIILEPGDRVHIPKKDKFVYISGRVKNPGAYTFQPGKGYDYYVSQAGGYGKNADKSNTQVFHHYDDVVQSIEPHCIEPGSVIVVPATVRHRIMTQVVIPLISVLATTIGVAVAIYGIK